MSKTVIGIFKLESDAQSAQNYLLANGFGDGEVDIKTASYKSAPDDLQIAEPEADWVDRIGNFFKELFNDDHEETQRYAHAGKHGTIVTVHANSTEEAMKAAAIMDEYGAEDINAAYPADDLGKRYEDPILNPPAVSEQQDLNEGTFQDTNRYSEAESIRSKSRIIERHVQQSSRLRQEHTSTGTMHVSNAGTDRGQNVSGEYISENNLHATRPDSDDTLEQQEILNKTLQERDALISDIVSNKVQEQPLQNRGV